MAVHLGSTVFSSEQAYRQLSAHLIIHPVFSLELDQLFIQFSNGFRGVPVETNIKFSSGYFSKTE